MADARRVVTAHAAEGKAIVQIDGALVEPSGARPSSTADTPGMSGASS